MRLLVIDDEIRTREHLERKISWTFIGITEVRTAANGLEALDIISIWEPDILLCDVRMPRMDGVEFARLYRENGGDGELIYLSGYSDKEYLKAAIKMKAFNYIEKPIDIKEVMDTVASAVKSKTYERQMQVGYDRSLPFLRQEMVRKIISDPNSAHVQKALESKETFLLPSKSSLTVLAVALFWKPSLIPEDWETVHEDVLQKLGEMSLLSSIKGISGFDYKKLLIIILPGVYRNNFQEGKYIVEQLAQELGSILDPLISFRIGIGEPVRCLSEIPLGYNSAVKACKLLFYEDEKKLSFADVVKESTSIQYRREDILQFREELRKGNMEGARRELHLLTTRIRELADPDIVRVQDIYFQYLIIILETAFNQGFADREKVEGRRYIWKEIGRLMSLKQLEEYILSFLDLFKEKDIEDNGKIRDILRYINAHFHEKRFTIQMIADHVGFNETYLSVYFKKYRGQTIKEYINDLRIVEAKSMLASKQMKLYEIAMRLGFADSNYFTSFFKKVVGCTPSEYREKINR
ncbi:HTH-type transcriptional activator RhaR [Paenibacillus auburnensis]|uniref:HTH-type transcriptional activator RhaR n=1 Tax=Paenibacillus auburnensis TaxID=2905649 RepID=A0ABN8GGE8_9BACL|nr:helix-turn-helix domain-containing protein [Paenibacillus auburnensis]CAH1208397.1 HTH-type transcriptional activator RhaR [Paenibacillus auburnensis]